LSQLQLFMCKIFIANEANFSGKTIINKNLQYIQFLLMRNDIILSPPTS